MIRLKFLRTFLLILGISIIGHVFGSISGNFTRTKLNYKTKFQSKRESNSNGGNGAEQDFYSYSHSHPYGSYTYENRNRKLALPKGTQFSLTPEIIIPVMDNEDKDFISVGAKFKSSFPLTITFNQVSLGYPGDGLWDNFLFRKKSFWDSPSQPQPSHLVSYANSAFLSDNLLSGDNQLHQPPSLSRKLRDVFAVNNGNRTTRQFHNYERSSVKTNTCQSRSLSDRKMLLQKLELVLSTGLVIQNPKDCLLRAVCEVHEFPMILSGFGLLGEYVMMAISVRDLLTECPESDPTRKSLLPFGEAEAAGKLGKCKAYTRKCDQSLFSF